MQPQGTVIPDTHDGTTVSRNNSRFFFPQNTSRLKLPPECGSFYFSLFFFPSANQFFPGIQFFFAIYVVTNSGTSRIRVESIILSCFLASVLAGNNERSTSVAHTPCLQTELVCASSQPTKTFLMDLIEESDFFPNHFCGSNVSRSSKRGRGGLSARVAVLMVVTNYK